MLDQVRNNHATDTEGLRSRVTILIIRRTSLEISLRSFKLQEKDGTFYFKKIVIFFLIILDN